MNISAALLLPTQLRPSHRNRIWPLSFIYKSQPKQTSRFTVPVARLFGPAIFEASRLHVLFLEVDEGKDLETLPRTYTLTHSDVTAEFTLAISRSIHRSQLQGWYNRFYRDEVVAEWLKVKGKMSLHVHCHISGGHFLLDLFAKLRFFIFYKELPVVLKAFVHGDGSLFRDYPELEEAQVWVYFHSNIPEFNRVECWGSLKYAGEPFYGGGGKHRKEMHHSCSLGRPEPCEEACSCCYPSTRLIHWSQDPSEQRNQSDMKQTNKLVLKNNNKKS